MLSWQFLRFSVTGTPGPIEATNLSKMRVKLDNGQYRIWYCLSVFVTYVCLSGEMKDPTLPCGHPVPPYTKFLMVTWFGGGTAPVLTSANERGEAIAVAASIRVKNVLSMFAS